MGTRARAPHVPQHLSEGHHSLLPVCLGARLSREPAPLFYILGHKAALVPHCVQPPFCKYVKRKNGNVRSQLECFPSARTFNHVIMYRELVGVQRLCVAVQFLYICN